MLSRPTYEGLLPWPRGYWDDWMREPPQRRGREVLRPEISRTFHFGQKGGTSGNIYSSYLDSIQLNVADVNWAQEDVGYLERDVCVARASALGQGGGGRQVLPHVKHRSLAHRSLAHRSPSLLPTIRYDARFKQRVLSAQVVDAGSAKQRAGSNGDVLVEYRGLSNGGSCFERVAKQLGIMDNIKANVPRTAYKGVVEFAWNGGYIFVAPPVAEISW
jgi:alpha-1,3-mannosyl-glycoprotein beta-1,2-N-acetylglucosaminyltransferase